MAPVMRRDEAPIAPRVYQRPGDSSRMIPIMIIRYIRPPGGLQQHSLPDTASEDQDGASAPRTGHLVPE